MTVPATISLLQPQSSFRGRLLPEPGVLAGYAALSLAFDIEYGLPARLVAIGKRHRKFEKDGWLYTTPRHRPQPTLAGHLTFALRYEGLALSFLRDLFETIDPQAIESLVKAAPTGRYARRIWFLYEWLTGQTLNLSKAPQGVYVPVVDPALQIAMAGVTSRRHRVRDNVPGTRAICPLVGCRDSTFVKISEPTAAHVRELLTGVPVDALSRVADHIEVRELAAARALGGALSPTTAAMTLSGLEALLERLLQGADTQDSTDFHDFARRTASSLDATVAAAVIGFAFAARHANLDESGVAHLSLIQHIAGHETVTGFPIPILSACLDDRTTYFSLLLSARLLPRRPGLLTFDATPHVEFLVRARQRAVAEHLPQAIAATYGDAQAVASAGFQP